MHRDLAARNILVGDDKVLKISDFGLSKDGTYVKNSTGKIPLRWLSTEAMRDRFYSTASDVYVAAIFFLFAFLSSQSRPLFVHISISHFGVPEGQSNLIFELNEIALSQERAHQN